MCVMKEWFYLREGDVYEGIKKLHNNAWSMKY